MPNITNREAAEALIRQQIIDSIVQDAPKSSIVMQLGRRLPNMTSNQTRMRVLDTLPTAYWVDGDTGFKQTSMPASWRLSCRFRKPWLPMPIQI